MIETAINKITAQQPKEQDQVWAVGEQLKDFCRHSPKDAELIAQDLDVPEMSLAYAEKKIKAYADSHKVGNSSCVPPQVAEDILRNFYGLSPRSQNHSEPIVISTSPPPKPKAVSLDLGDFL